MKNFIQPNWPAPKNIKAYTTLRIGGVSAPPYDQFNLAEHVGDNEKHVQENRARLKKILALPEEPIWIKQTHSTIVLKASTDNIGKEADATFSHDTNQICCVLTADCLPIFLCDKKGTRVAAIHAGWRGLANGIIPQTIHALNISGNDLLAWLGPAISSSCYEVGNEVREFFLESNAKASTAFSPSKNDRWLADLYELARLSLKALNVESIYGGEYCTFRDRSFYSYRRDGEKTGRMASLIYLDKASIS